MQQSRKWQRWQAFVSLNWYAGVISFIFRFVAMTSEPLLALGVILSAADFLQQGHLMAHNPTLQASWAWAQALAIEASTGPTFSPRICMNIALVDRCPHWKDGSSPLPWISMQHSM
jgi:hypothetical protein